ncbi:MAG: RNA-directed DNA polymerase [Bacilli bacterium]|nr:RNA-directed DNA polymerase [Bacilli bacterium]
MNSNEKKFLLSLFSFDKNLSDNEKIKKMYIMSNRIEKYYHHFTIKKRNGTERNILCPYTQLKKIQLNILNGLLYDKSVSVFAKAYIKNSYLVDNTIIHRGHKYILKLDIHNFFENISYVDIFNIYKEYGFSNALCSLLAHLTTYNDYLPQGAPTSPYLSNLVLRNFDYKVGKWCEKQNINYTRYSDDMTFSMNEYNKDLIRFIRINLFKQGLELNNEKICLIHHSQQQKITGIVVNDKIQVDSKYRKKIRQELYYINKYGLDEHLERNKTKDKKKYLKILYGKILFVLSVDKNNKEFIKYKMIVRKILNG